jgi:activator of 2-hydroxyglutaryl-CoA dehydratase
MRMALERELGITLFVPDEPQITGALGAALFAQEQ